MLQTLTGNDSPIAYVAFALGTMAALTCINLAAVDVFAKIESGLAITKVIIIILFILVAFGIWIGLWGNPQGELVGMVEDGFKGMGVNFGSGSLYHDLFPNGFAVVLILMVVVLVPLSIPYCMGN